VNLAHDARRHLLPQRNRIFRWDAFFESNDAAVQLSFHSLEVGSQSHYDGFVGADHPKSAIIEIETRVAAFRTSLEVSRKRMGNDKAIVIDLDGMFAADGLDVEENVLFDAYWAFDRDELSIIAHVHRHFNEERSDIIPERSHWFFGNNISIPTTVEVGLAIFGLDSVEDVIVQIPLENGEIFRIPYRPLVIPGY
jgi:hypothetical protein